MTKIQVRKTGRPQRRTETVAPVALPSATDLSRVTLLLAEIDRLLEVA